MAYDSGASSFTDVNFLRLLVGDTDATYLAFTDNELTALITRFTTGAVINWPVATAWALRAIACDPDRLWQWKLAAGGGISLLDLMEQTWARAEVLLG